MKIRISRFTAIIAIARPLLTAVYNMLKENEPYNFELYLKAAHPPAHREASFQEALCIIQRQGI